MSKKIILGFGSILPLAVALASTLGLVAVIFTGSIEVLGPLVLIPFVIVNVVMSLVALVVHIFYGVHIFTSGRVPSAARLPWLLVMLFVNMLPLPIYWYLYIVREPAPAMAA